MFQRFRSFFTSSIGRKFLMSLSGACLMGFVLVHLLGNLTLFADSEGRAFAAYAHAIESNPLLPLAEIGLLVLFVAHIGLGIRVAIDNREARPHRYKDLNAHGDRTLASTTMIVTGLLVLIFLLVHLSDFRFAERDENGFGPMVVSRLRAPLGALVYLVGVAALGVHVWHAFQSAFQTLGLNHPRYRPLIRRAGTGLALVVGLGFAAFPVVLFASPGSFARGTPAQESARGSVPGDLHEDASPAPATPTDEDPR